MISEMQPALIDNSFEFFAIGKTKFQLTAGCLKIVEKLPEHFSNLLRLEISTDQPAKIWLTRLGFISDHDRVDKYYHCNYSASDSNPDICVEGKLGNREFVRCIERGNCPAEGFLCKFPCDLTKREAGVAILIARGQTDDQISYELGISKNTIRNHKNSIEVKIGMLGKPAIAAWAAKNLMI